MIGTSRIGCWAGRGALPARHAEWLALLRTLKLPAIADHVAAVALKAATATLTHEAFLYELVQAAVEQREPRRIARLLRQSGLPPEKTFPPRPGERCPPAVRQQVERLQDGAFLAEAVPIVAVGRPGVGKRRLLAAMAYQPVGRGQPVLWTATARRVQRLLAAKRALRLPQALAQLDRYALLVRDDIGYVQHDQDEMEGLFAVRSERYERRSSGISTNLVFSAWVRIVKRPLTTMAAIDRVVHHSGIRDLMPVASYRAQAAAHQQRQQRGRPATTVAAPLGTILADPPASEGAP